ncbi:hypothetical protein Tco_0077433 [Tanacetum coccineum]
MWLEHELRGRQRFDGKCVMQANWLKERDAETASLKARLSLKEAEAAETIRLRGQVAVVEAAEAARANELNVLKERNAVLEGQVAVLESATISKDVELASSNAQVAKVLTPVLYIFNFCHILNYGLIILNLHVSALETTCSGLRDEVMRYKLFKERVEAVQDKQVKVLSDRVASIDSDLMEMALYMDEEFYPRRAIDKGIQDGSTAGIDHGKAGRGDFIISLSEPNTTPSGGFGESDVFQLSPLLLPYLTCDHYGSIVWISHEGRGPLIILQDNSALNHEAYHRLSVHVVFVTCYDIDNVIIKNLDMEPKVDAKTGLLGESAWKQSMSYDSNPAMKLHGKCKISLRSLRVHLGGKNLAIESGIRSSHVVIESC